MISTVVNSSKKGVLSNVDDRKMANRIALNATQVSHRSRYEARDNATHLSDSLTNENTLFPTIGAFPTIFSKLGWKEKVLDFQ